MFGIQGISSFPLKVDTGASFSFKIIVKKGVREEELRAIRTETMTITTDANNVTITIVYNDQLTPILVQQTVQNAYPVFMKVAKNSIAFTAKESGTVSAILYSPAGKAVSVLLANHSIAENENHILINVFHALPSGTYILHCTGEFTGGQASIREKITLGQ